MVFLFVGNICKCAMWVGRQPDSLSLSLFNWNFHILLHFSLEKKWLKNGMRRGWEGRMCGHSRKQRQEEFVKINIFICFVYKSVTFKEYIIWTALDDILPPAPAAVPAPATTTATSSSPSNDPVAGICKHSLEQGKCEGGTEW